MTCVREPNAEPLVGYRLLEPLGSGGFGEVWKCEAPGGIYKAIKFVFGNLNADDGDAARADQELKALHRVKEIRHPFILSMDRIEIVDGELVIVMELADKSLFDYFHECRSAGLVGIPRDALLRYLRDTAEALDHMYEKYNLQHLDIKPRNLFLVSNHVKVADFGLVRRLERQAGTFCGATPVYAPPETFQGTITATTDQYSLAIVYQELLTGQLPFNGKNVRLLALQHTKEEPELRALAEAERPIVARALAKDPTERFPNCMAFVRALYNVRTKIGRAEAGGDGPGGDNDEDLDSLDWEGSLPPGTTGKMPVLPADSPRSRRPPPVADPPGARLSEARPAASRQGEIKTGNGQHRALLEGPQAGSLCYNSGSEVGLTQNLPDTGSVRPTLVIGVGGFGRIAIGELQNRFVDQYGNLGQLPLIRFLFLDTDAESLKEAKHELVESAGSASEVHHLPLQPVGYYRRRRLDQLNEWLPREKLYTLPRSLHTQGGRALGRLAFADNHLRLFGRLRRALQQITHPDVLHRSVANTGLALRDSQPRVYVLASARGGCGGMIVDLGFTVRCLLRQLHFNDAEIVGFVYCGAPEDPASSPVELANVYATLTELNHFHNPSVVFTAQYGAEGPTITDRGGAFQAVYLLKTPHRRQDDADRAAAHLSNYLFHDLLTPLGRCLDRQRGRQTGGTQTPPTPFRSFGTFTVWFPRGLLLQETSRRACLRLLANWSAETPVRGGHRLEACATNTPRPVEAMREGHRLEACATDRAESVNDRWSDGTSEVEAACERVLADPGLRFEAICARIAETAGAALSSAAGALPLSLPDSLTALLAKLEEQSLRSVAVDEPGSWARQALACVREWVGDDSGPVGYGRPGTTERGTIVPRSSAADRPGFGEGCGVLLQSKLQRALVTTVHELAREWNERLMGEAVRMMDYPGRRIAAADAALARFIVHAMETAATEKARFAQHEERTQRAARSLQTALEGCVNAAAGFSLFGGRVRRALRLFMDHLAAFARQRLSEEVIASGIRFFIALHDQLNDRARDLVFCRQRLRRLHEVLAGQGSLEWEFAQPGTFVPGSDPSPSPWERRKPGTAGSSTGCQPVAREPGALAIGGTAATGSGASGTAATGEITRLVFPEGDADLQTAAERFLARLGPDQWLNLDQGMQERVFAEMGGAYQAWMSSGDLGRVLAGPLVDQAAAVLGEYLPITDVAQVELESTSSGEPEASSTGCQPVARRSGASPTGGRPSDRFPERLRDYFANAAPLVSAHPGGVSPAPCHGAYLLVPASDAGTEYGKAARDAIRETQLEIVRVPGQGDLMLCREEGYLLSDDLAPILAPCRGAYEHLSAAPTTSPHSRFDLMDWAPLE